MFCLVTCQICVWRTVHAASLLESCVCVCARERSRLYQAHCENNTSLEAQPESLRRAENAFVATSRSDEVDDTFNLCVCVCVTCAGLLMSSEW